MSSATGTGSPGAHGIVACRARAVGSCEVRPGPHAAPDPRTRFAPHMSARAVGAAVLGMGRSGTSAVASVLVAAGFSAGRNGDLLEADHSNPAGYFENNAIWRLNDEILVRLGGSWFDPPGEAALIAARPWAQEQLAAAFARLLEDAEGAPLALKDPRIGVMMALWKPVIAQRLHPLLVIRDPYEIALSLLRREAMPMAFGLAAWELHMTSVLAHLQGDVVTVAPYHELLRSPPFAAEIIGAITSHLADDRAERVNPNAAHEALRPDLHRCHATPGDHDQLTARQHELWRMLKALPAGDQTIDAPPEVLRTSAAARAGVRAETERKARAEQLHTLTQQLAECAAARTRAEHLLTAACEERAALSAVAAGERAELTAAADRAQHALDVIARSKSWTLTAPLRAGMRHLRESAIGRAAVASRLRARTRSRRGGSHDG